MNIETVNLNDRSYPIYIGKGASEEPESLINRIKGSDVAIVSDEVVAPLYLNQLLKWLQVPNVITYVLPQRVQEMNLTTVHTTIAYFLEVGFRLTANLLYLSVATVCPLTCFVPF